MHPPAITATIATTILGMALHAADAPLPTEIEDPENMGINKEAPHATLMPYATLAQALAGKRHESPFCRVLNGPWKFNWVKHPAQRPVDFYKPDFDVSAWKDIPVPSNWQVLGYGTPYYRNLGFIFKVDFPRVMSEPPKDFTCFDERNPVGSYRRSFEVPAAWQGRRTFLTFDGVDSAFFLWINGEKVGFGTNSRCRNEFDVTKYLKPGANLLAAEVYRFSAGSYFEDQDMYRLSGIFRNVTLWSAPQVHLRDFFITTDLDAAYRDAVLTVKAKVKNYGDQPAAATTLQLALHGPDGKPTGVAASGAVPALAPGQEQEVALSAPVAAPVKWTAETPVLYTSVLTLGDEIISARTGFRKVECKGRVFCVNGVPVKLKGVNRHENYPDTGHYVTEERMMEDLRLIKGCNSNHVRTCHYTDDPRWYELCDEWGVWLVAEANVESHGLYNVLDREPRARKAIVQRNIDNVESLKNHPSIVIWSLGNENGGGDNYRAAHTAIKAIDATRATHYEPFGCGDSNPCDLDSNMYNSVDGTRHMGEQQRKKPYYLCEYAHAMNNSMGSIGDYNDVFDAYEGVMGGAIWEWQDQSLWNDRVPGAPKHLVYGGGFGEKPNDGYFICKGVIFADRSVTPKYPEAKAAYQWVGIAADDLAAGRLKIRNKYQFTDLDRFDLAWTVSEDGTVIDQGVLPRLACKPLSETTLTVPMKAITPKPGAVYHLRVAFTLPKDEVWAKAGWEAATAQFPLPVVAPIAAGTKADTLAALTVADGTDQVVVDNAAVRIAVSKADGAINELSFNGKTVIAGGGGPRLHLWRAPHRNDDNWVSGEWSSRGLDKLEHKARTVTVNKLAGGAVQVVADIACEGRAGTVLDHQAVYTVCGDGTVAVDHLVDNRGERFVVARMGVRLFPDARLDRFTYLGRGPMENYNDRKRGSDMGLFTSTVLEQLTPYVKPMECGNHEDVRWLALTGADGAGFMAVAQNGVLTAAALPHKDEDLDKAGYAYQLPPSPGTVLSLNAATLGIGSGSCGPRTRDEYLVYSDPAAFSYVLRPVAAGTADLAALARQPFAARVAPVAVVRGKGGQHTFTCATPGAVITCAVDGGAMQPVTAPVVVKKGVVSVTASAPGFLPLPPRTLTVDTGIDRSAWKVVSTSSFQEGEGEAKNAIDDDAGTFWHTRWKPDEPKHPHEIVIDFGAEIEVAAVTCRGRPDQANGRIKDYEIYLGDSTTDWGKPAAKGRFANNDSKQRVALAKPVKARYLRLVAKSEVNGKPWASIADISVVPVK